MFPEARFHRKRTEKSDASPSRCEVGSGQLAIGLDRQCCLGGRRETRICEVAVAKHRHRVGHAEEGAKRQPQDAVSFSQIVFFQRADFYFHRFPSPALLAAPPSHSSPIAAAHWTDRRRSSKREV